MIRSVGATRHTFAISRRSLHASSASHIRQAVNGTSAAAPAAGTTTGTSSTGSENYAIAPSTPALSNRQLAPARLARIRPRESLSVWTEAVRYRKAVVCLLADRLREEFPRLRDHAVPYHAPQPRHDILTFHRDGLVYPGACTAPDPELSRQCTLEVSVADLLPFMRGERAFRASADAAEATGNASTTSAPVDDATLRQRLTTLVSSTSPSDTAQSSTPAPMTSRTSAHLDTATDRLTLIASHFPAYGMNKKWLVDTLVRVVEAVRDEENAAVLDGVDVAADGVAVAEKKAKAMVQKENGVAMTTARFPDAWKRPDLATTGANERVATKEAA